MTLAATISYTLKLHEAMKKSLIICAALLFALSPRVPAGEFRDKGETIAVDFPAGWSVGSSDDSAVTLKLEKGKAFFEFSKQDSELGDCYLQARVREQVDSLRSKGTALTGDIRSAGIRGVSKAYYTSYESMGSEAYMAFFTYNGASYAVSASGLDEGDFRAIVSGIRKPGEKIETPKPYKAKTSRGKKGKNEDEEAGFSGQKPAEPGPEIPAAEIDVSTGSILNAFARSEGPEVPRRDFLDVLIKLAGEREGGSLPPYLPRRPLPLKFWGILAALWVAGAFYAKAAAAAYLNPKQPPRPAEVPPDFFFPFVVSRAATLRKVTYNILTRQNQLLLADFPCGYESYAAVSFYGCLFFHAFWSVLAHAGRGGLVAGLLLRLPFGRAFASLPEIFFIVPFVIGAAMYFTRLHPLRLYDAQSNLLMEVKPDAAYCIIRDGGGKEVARLVRKGGFMNRRWEFVDTDNQVVFSIRDDFPRGTVMRKLFGNLGGVLRSHYGIFAQERRAGFVFLDPTSPDRFQVHMDFAFARLSHPAQILAAMLYVISRERDPLYPSPF